jgi:hypothetical protein
MWQGPDVASIAAPRPSLRDRLAGFPASEAALVMVLLVAASSSLVSPVFLSVANIEAILPPCPWKDDHDRDGAPPDLGRFDLSVGSTLAHRVVAGLALNAGVPAGPAITPGLTPPCSWGWPMGCSSAPGHQSLHHDLGTPWSSQVCCW